MSTDLERRLEADMADLAARTPWTSGSAGSVRRLVTRRHRRRIVLRMAAVLLVIAGSVATVAVRRTDNASGPFVLLDSPTASTTGAAAQPPGREVTLEPWSDSAADSVSTHTVTTLLINGRDQFALRLEAMFAAGVLTPYVCQEIRGSGACAPMDNGRPAPAHLPELGGSDHYVYWTGLPPGAAYVELRVGTDVLWQRPIDGVVAFPITSWGELESMVAYGQRSEELDHADLQRVSPIGSDQFTSTALSADAGEVDARWAGLADEQKQEREKLATTLFGMCRGDDPSLARWSGCIATVNFDLQKAAASDAFTGLLGSRAPRVRGTSTHAQVIDLSDRAGHWVIVNFSGTTCAPCADQLTALKTFVDEQSVLDDGAELYTVDFGSDFDATRSFYDDHLVNWPVIWDGDSAIAAEFGITSIPETWIIDPIGNVVLRTVTPLTADQLTRYLDQAKTRR